VLESRVHRRDCVDLRYNEWLPDAVGLKGVVTAYWRVAGDASRVHSSAILPDGQVELVFNLGDPVGLVGPAYTGNQPDRAVVGPLSRAIRLVYRGPVNTFGIRFHPARGAAFFSQPATSLTNKLVPLAQISSPLDRTLSCLLAGNSSPDTESCRAALDQVLLEQLASSSPADMPVAAMVDRLARSDPAPPIAEIARELGISSRQVQRRFLASVGVPPKQFVRVLRFARLWQTASMSPPETWAALAAEHGYADQAHMVREFRAFGIEPPTHFFTAEWYDTTELSRVSGPAEGVRTARDVRSVQDPFRKPPL
jgi:AraC-like DNA-binding protein